jgi:hypothetical protein
LCDSIENLFFTAKFSFWFYFRASSPIKLMKLGHSKTSGEGGTSNNKPPRRIIMMGPIKKKYWASVRSILLHSSFFGQIHGGLLRHWPASAHTGVCLNYVESQNYFPDPNRHILDFRLRELLLWSRITYSEHRWRSSSYTT